MNYCIVTDTGRFGSVEKAAFAEGEIDWLSADTTDAAVCSICYGAWDIKRNLIMKKEVTVRFADIKDFCLSVSDKDTTVVLLGYETVLQASRQTGIPQPSLDGIDEQGYRIQSMVIENTPIVCIYGRDRVGTLYGAYAYEEFHGIRFIAPGDAGVAYDRKYDRSGETVFEICESPSFRTRGAYSQGVNDDSTDFILWASRRRLNYLFLHQINHVFLLKKLGIGMAKGGHEMIYEFMDPSHPYPYKHDRFSSAEDDKKQPDPYEISPLYSGDVNGDGVLSYGEAHPEWYPEVEGVRRLFRDYESYALGYATGDYLCTSSVDGMTEYTRLIVEALVDGEWKYVDYVDLWALDNGTWCDCEECRKDPSLSYRQLMLAYRLDKAIKQATAEGRINRRIQIIVPAYHETLPAPDKPLPKDFDYDTISVVLFVIERCYQHDIDDPVCTETNVDLWKQLKEWTDGHYKGELFIGEYYNVSAFAANPIVLKKRILHDIPAYYSIGARHFHYMHITARQWGVSALTNYLYTNLLWNIHAQDEHLLEEYFYLRYGVYAKEMRSIYDQLEETTANCKFYLHYQYIHRVRYALFGHLLSGKTGFPNSLHMQLCGQADDPQAGLSLEEVTKRFDAIYDYFEKTVSSVYHNDYIAEDAVQLEYGRKMLRFLYAMMLYNSVRDEDAALAADALEAIRTYGEELRNMTAPLAGYDYDDGGLYVNGLTASRMTPVYERWLHSDSGTKVLVPEFTE